MAIKIANRVKETSATTGTGAFALGGAAPGGYVTFASKFATGDLVPYTASLGSSWEVGLGTFDSTAGTLTRTVIYASSNAGAAVSFAVGAKDVYCSLPSDHVSAVRVHDGGSTNPVVTDDSSKGFAAYQSLWALDTGEYWRCIDHSVGAADWSPFSVVSVGNIGSAFSYPFRLIGGQFNGLAPQKCVSLTDSQASFDFAYGDPSNAACVGGYGFRTFWGLSSGLGFGFTSGASTCKVDAGAQGSTSGATPTLIFPDAVTDSAWYVPLNGITEFTVKVVAWDNTAKIGKTWSLVGTVKRGASGAATFIGSVTKTVLQADAGAAAWDVGLTIANTGTSGASALNLTVTGAAATPIEWGAGITATQLAMW